LEAAVQRLALVVLVVTVALAAAFIAITAPQLPELVASHFGADSRPNGWMSRGTYTTTFLLLSGVLPALVAAVFAWRIRKAPGTLKLPNREYWLAPEHREATVGFVTSQGFVLGALLAVFMAGVHWIVLRANAVQPARLPLDVFWPVLAMFLLGMAAWGLVFYLRFRVRP
jgi:uncharacterized membrane protein